MPKRKRDGLYRKPGSSFWWVRFWVEGQEYRRSTRCTDFAAASVEGRRLQVEVEEEVGASGRGRRPGGMRLLDLGGMDAGRSVDAGHHPRHRAALDYRWGAIYRVLGRDTSPAEVSDDDLDRYVATRRQEGTRGQTIRREIQALRRGYQLARRKGHRYREPNWPEIRSDARDDRRRGHLRPIGDIRAVLSKLGPDARDRLTVALLTGLRDGELHRLRYEWVERLPESAHVPAVLRLPEDATKDREERAVPLPAEALAILERRWRQEQQKARKDERNPDPRLFPIESHKRALATASKGAGLSYRLTLRDLRHTYSTLAAAESGDLTAVRDLLGHSDLRTTSIYQSSTLDRLARASAAVAAAVSAPAQSDRHSKKKKSGKKTGRPLKSRSKVARPGGFEPPTYGFEGVRPIKKSTG